CQQSKEVPYTF
nr:immunoglobulin light chain junction region [Mus musculus]NSL97147.1 immunoglobulin light chain junction region [Mus musculus]NSL97174.1 immunoglobulin light chain junction region [Mus musculus]NSL97244.1 immunoglobulin light chain junction region [Mus musculus]NSL97476.1 immunoglobulin light chain junction region [Mus musculus]